MASPRFESISPRLEGNGAGAMASPLRMKHLKSKVSKTRACAVPIRKKSDTCNHVYAPGHTLQLSDKKKLSLLQLKKREEMNAVRHRLRGILIQKLVAKLGKRKEPTITKHVDEFVKDKQSLSAQDLVDLEKAIREDKSMPTPRNSPRNGEMPSLNGEPQTDGQPILTARRAPCACCGKMDCKFNNCAPLPAGVEWEALQTYQALAAAQKQEEEDRIRALKQKELKLALDKQIQDTEDRRRREKNQDADYIRYMHRDVEKFREENEAQHAKVMKQHAETRKIWEDQLEAERVAREARRAQMLRDEQRDAEMAAAALAKEKETLRQRKLADAAAHLAILKENEENDKRKAEERRREQAVDIKLAQDYADRLDREEKARQMAFNKRMENLEKFAKWADEGPAGQGRREEERRMEELLLKEQLKKEERDRQREENDKRASIERQRLMTEQNQKLIDERNRLAELERTKDKEYAEKYKDVGMAHKQAEKDRRRAQQKKQREYGSVLLEQMHQERSKHESMTAAERSLNKEALNTIQFDPVFHSRVYHRLRMRPETANIRPKSAGSSRPKSAGSSRPKSSNGEKRGQAWA